MQFRLDECEKGGCELLRTNTLSLQEDVLMLKYHDGCIVRSFSKVKAHWIVASGVWPSKLYEVMVLEPGRHESVGKRRHSDVGVGAVVEVGEDCYSRKVKFRESKVRYEFSEQHGKSVAKVFF